jgi:glycosyltransferase involved in cell wall biosynthesis
MFVQSYLELPSPPADKSGWPWQSEDYSFSSKVSNNRQNLKISIITPSFNQAAFLEETIRSVLLQNYPNLEYIIIDGGSNDGSVDIIRKYEPWLSYWVSEPDEGQGDALNKGFKICSGDIVAWLNSDDYYWPNVLNRISKVFHKDSSLGLVFGDIQIRNNFGKLSGPIGFRNIPSRMLQWLEIPFQPASFLRTSLIRQIGAIDHSFHYVLDVEILLRAMANALFYYLPAPLAVFRIHRDSKTNKFENNFGDELLILRIKVLNHLNLFPSLLEFNPREISCNFYRLAAKHYYQGGCFNKAAKCLLSACQEFPKSTFSVISDEGIRWFARLALPINIYRTLSHRFRSGPS